jgi:hypothetical protein
VQAAFDEAVKDSIDALGLEVCPLLVPRVRPPCYIVVAWRSFPMVCRSNSLDNKDPSGAAQRIEMELSKCDFCPQIMQPAAVTSLAASTCASVQPQEALESAIEEFRIKNVDMEDIIMTPDGANISQCAPGVPTVCCSDAETA